MLDRIKGKVLYNEPMKQHTTLKVGGPADILIIPESLEDIKCGIVYCNENKIPIHVIGNGSKLLVSDKGVRGLVFKIANTFDNVKILDKQVISSAGCSLSKMVELTAGESLSGFEFAAGIPGAFGGAIAMNAGTRYGSISDVVRMVTTIDLMTGNMGILENSQCNFGYRSSIFLQRTMIILKGEIELRKGNERTIRDRVNKIMKRRMEVQPLDKPSAGSTFKNPPKISAGKLIEMVGLKGVRKGDAKISSFHANFIVNLGNAKARDVIALKKLAQERVRAKYGIQLDSEIRVIGDW